MDITEKNYYFGRLAYEAYCEQTNWKSAITGAQLPAFYDTPEAVQRAWAAAATAVISAVK